MPIVFTCPHCGVATSVADQYAGQTGMCAQCGKPITIPALRRRSWIANVIVVTVVGVVVIVLLLPLLQAPAASSRRAHCFCNMKNISLALLSFESEKGRFPAMVDPAKPNQRACSWRVQILPGLEEKHRFERYHVNEPWNAPKNCKLADPMPPSYRCPSNDSPAPLDTDYLAVVGPKAMFRDVGSTTSRDISDGLSKTLMVVESHKSGIHWMEPRDMKADDADLGVDSGAPSTIGSAHSGGANVAMADGSVHFIDAGIDPEVLKAMTTINGGEKVDPYALGR